MSMRHRNAWAGAVWLAAIVSVWSAPPALAEGVRMKLVVTRAVAGGESPDCVQAAGKAYQTKHLTLTENDVLSFRPEGNLIRLGPSSVGARERGNMLANHCYVLVIDGHEAGRGVILWTDSPVLSGSPTLVVTESRGGLDLQFLSGNHGNYYPILDSELRAVLETKPRAFAAPP